MSVISKFCGHNELRTWMNEPNRAGGYLYATNGHVAIRMPDDPSIDAADLAPISMMDLFNRLDPSAFTWHDIPSLGDVRKCPVCHGSGLATTPCPDCDGEGDFDYGHHTYECRHCHGDGFIGAASEKDKDAVPCDYCCGTGIEPYDGQDVGTGYFAKRYLLLISETFPGAKIGVPEDRESVAMWRCGDVVGALMPMRK